MWDKIKNSHFYKPTPVICRMMGDAILYGCGLSTVHQITEGNTTFAVVSVIIAMVGKFLSDMPKEEN